MTIQFACGNCDRPYPVEGVPYCCPDCGGIYSIKGSGKLIKWKGTSGEPGIWRFRRNFGLPMEITPISLGEGNTPLVWVEVKGRSVGVKCEFLNPTGSFKDRGSALIASFLKSRGVREAVEDSSGNAGASFAAYAARAGIKAKIFIPENASGPKRRQIEMYGADLISVIGNRSAVTDAALDIVKKGMPYASHACLPFNIPGYATILYEIVEEIKGIPGTIILPVGQGGLLLGIAFSMQIIRIGNTTSVPPRIIGVQAQACAPFCIPEDDRGLIWRTEEHETIAEGVKVSNPIKKEAVLREVNKGFGQMFSVEEDDILRAREDLARLGFYVEPTSAIVWPILKKEIDRMPDPIIVILTGSGYKYG